MIFLSIDYHYIGSESEYPNGGIYPVSLDKFKRQLEELGSFFSFISQQDLLSAIEGRKPLPENSCLVTFDDGLRCQYELALPILEAKGIPAVFFVSTLPYVEEKICMVHQIQKLRSLISPEEFYKLVNQKLQEVYGQDIDSFAAARHKTIETRYRYDDASANKLKYLLNNILNSEEKEAIIGGIFDKYCPDKKEFISNLYLSREQVSDLGKRGYLGVHSHDHVSLATLDDEDLRDNLSRCKNELEAISGADLYSIAYPYGSKYDVNDRVTAICQQLGLKIGFTFERAFNTSLNDPLLFARADTNDAPGGKCPAFSLAGGQISIAGNFGRQRSEFVKE